MDMAMGSHCDDIENFSPGFCLTWLDFGWCLGLGLSKLLHQERESGDGRLE